MPADSQTCRKGSDCVTEAHRHECMLWARAALHMLEENLGACSRGADNAFFAFTPGSRLMTQMVHHSSVALPHRADMLQLSPQHYSSCNVVHA